MKNQYCKICGTLLPEDGICLRCGAVYHFADDGQIIEPVRKVKKVAAKPAKKKGIIVKRAVDPSEAETQTIPISEEFFSRSNHLTDESKHEDWTSAKKQDVSFHKAEGHKPAYEYRTPEPPKETIPQKEPTKKGRNSTISTSTLVAIFLLSAILAGIVTYVLLGGYANSTVTSLEETTVEISTVATSPITTTAQVTTQSHREALRDAYNDVLDSFMESTDELAENRYYLVDIDHNGTPELLVQYNYDGVSYRKMAAYTYDDKLLTLGNTSDSFDGVLELDDEAYTFYQHMGSEISLDLLSIENQQLRVTNVVADYGIDYYRDRALEGYETSYRGALDKLTE